MRAIRHTTLIPADTALHVAQAGPSDGPLAILLHGFPDCWRTWRHLIDPLVEAGFRVMAPDQRGYNLSDKPEGISAYGLERLCDDVEGLIDASGQQRATLIGHDWGAAVAWWMAQRRPQRVARAVVINVPHPLQLRRDLWTRPAQLLRSAYMIFFLIPWLPEFLLLQGRGARLVGTLRAMSRPGSWTHDELAALRSAWTQPGAMTAMLNWYRALLLEPLSLEDQGLVEPPLLAIWGQDDPVLTLESGQRSMARCRQGRLHPIPNAGHWPHIDAPEAVRDAIMDFIGEHGGTP